MCTGYSDDEGVVPLLRVRYRIVQTTCIREHTGRQSATAVHEVRLDAEGRVGHG